MHAPTKSIRALETPGQFDEWVAAFALALPSDVAFSHLTAARLWGLPLPSALQNERGLHVMRTTGRSTIIRDRCVHHKGLEHRSVEMSGNLSVTSLADTWIDLVAAFHSRLTLHDAVMMGDAAVELLRPTRLIDDRHPSADPASSEWWADPMTAGCASLSRSLLARPRFRGKRLAREALRSIRPRVWSPMESYSRMVFVAAELPEPQLNKTVYATSTGHRLGIVDLSWDGEPYPERVAGEYQGRDDHTEEELSRDEDNVRRLGLEDDGWKVLEIYSNDIYVAARRGKLISRLARWLGAARP